MSARPARRPYRPLAKDAQAVGWAAAPALVSGLFLAGGLHQPTELIFLAALCLLCGLLGAWRCHRTMGRASDIGLMTLYAAVLFWFWMPAFGGALSEDQWNRGAALIAIDNSHALRAFFAVSMFVFVMVLTYQIRIPGTVARKAARFLGEGPMKPRPRVVGLLVLATLVALAFYVVTSGGLGAAIDNVVGSRSVKKPWDSEGNFGTAMSPFHVISAGVLTTVVIIGLFMQLFYRLSTWERVALGVVWLLAFADLVLESGTRSVVLLTLLPPLLLYYRLRIAAKVPGRRMRMLLVASLVIGAVGIGSFQRAYRETGALEEDVAFEIDDNDFFLTTAYAVAIYDEEDQLTYDSPMWHIVTGPIPRVLWPGKPRLDVIGIYSWYIWGFDIWEHGRNTLPGIVGQYLLSWGWFGVLEIGFWLGLIARLGDSAFRVGPRRSLGKLSWMVILAYLFVTFRTIGFSMFPTVAVAIAAAHALTRRRRRHRPAPAADLPGSPAPPGARTHPALASRRIG